MGYYKSERPKPNKLLARVGAVLIILALLIPIFGYFVVALPGQVAYNKSFGGEISIIMDQPSLSGMSSGLTNLWKMMNQTWPNNHANIYGSAFYWDQTPDNSLASQDRYFKSEISRLNNYTSQYNAYVKAGTNIVIGLPLTDWYDKTVNQARAELSRNGGLDWAIRGAWLQQFAPGAYWFNLYATLTAVPLLLVGVALILRSGVFE